MGFLPAGSLCPCRSERFIFWKWFRNSLKPFRAPALAVPRDTVHHFAAAGGMADVNGVLQAGGKTARSRIGGNVTARFFVKRTEKHAPIICGRAGSARDQREDYDRGRARALRQNSSGVLVLGGRRPGVRCARGG